MFHRFAIRATSAVSMGHRMLSTRVRGTVKWFDAKKGFGFIITDQDNIDVFVHQSSIKSDGFRSLTDGQEVEFSVENEADGRKKANNVTGPNGKTLKAMPRPSFFSSDHSQY